MTDKINHRQLMAMTFMGLLSPVVRLFPRLSAETGGRVSWLGVIPGTIAGAVFIYIVYVLMDTRTENIGLADMIIKSLGKSLGKVVCLICALWMIVYAGFILRIGAERLISCAYPKSGILVPIVVMVGLISMAAFGKVRAIGGSSMIFMVLIAVTLIFTFAFAAPGVKLHNLLPVTQKDGKSIFKSAIPAFDIMSASVYFLFLIGRTDKKTISKKRAVVMTIIIGITAMLVTAVTIGTFSSAVVSHLQYPFFTLVRNVKVLKIVERFEAIIIVIWICADYIFISSLIMGVNEIAYSVIGRREIAVTVIAIIATAIVSMIISPNAFDLKLISDKYVTVCNVVFTGVIIPAILLTGRLKKRF